GLRAWLWWGEEAATAETSFSMACASASVTLGRDPCPLDTPPLFSAPEFNTMVLDPRLRISVWMRWLAPPPTAIMTVTDDTPRTMPSMVSALRSLLTRMARKAARVLLTSFMRRLAYPGLDHRKQFCRP